MPGVATVDEADAPAVVGTARVVEVVPSGPGPVVVVVAPGSVVDETVVGATVVLVVLVEDVGAAVVLVAGATVVVVVVDATVVLVVLVEVVLVEVVLVTGAAVVVVVDATVVLVEVVGATVVVVVVGAVVVEVLAVVLVEVVVGAGASVIAIDSSVTGVPFACPLEVRGQVAVTGPSEDWTVDPLCSARSTTGVPAAAGSTSKRTSGVTSTPSIPPVASGPGTIVRSRVPPDSTDRVAVMGEPFQVGVPIACSDAASIVPPCTS